MTFAVPPPNPAALAERCTARAAEHDRSARLAHEYISALLEAVTMPRRLGGGGLGLARATAVVVTVGRGDPATALVHAITLLQHGLIHRDGAPWPRTVPDAVGWDAEARFALINALRVEPEFGTPARGGLPVTCARRDGDGWRVTGRKIFSTGAGALVRRGPRRPRSPIHRLTSVS